MLLDRKRIQKWQKWIYGLMAILMVLFLVVLFLGFAYLWKKGAFDWE